jgi:hypothetical protein
MGVVGLIAIAGSSCQPAPVKPPPTPTPPAPVASAISPLAGPEAGGNSVTITGSGFSGATAVSIGSSAASFTVNSDSQVTAVAPAGTGTVDVHVAGPGGLSANTGADNYTYAPVPTITSVVPAFGPEVGGEIVTIMGTGFMGNGFSATAVSFGSTPAASFTVDSPTEITAVSPASTGLVQVSVTTPGGPSPDDPFSDSYLFIADIPPLPEPTVTSLSPNTGPTLGLNDVVITGTGFEPTSMVVQFGGVPAVHTFDSATQITATAPPGVGVVDVLVTTLGGQSENTEDDDYTYQPAPVVLLVAPPTGPSAGGNTVTITGTGLTGASAVTFNGNPAADINVISDTELTVTVPAGSLGVALVSVTTPGGTSLPTGLYTYLL